MATKKVRRQKIFPLLFCFWIQVAMEEIKVRDPDERPGSRPCSGNDSAVVRRYLLDKLQLHQSFKSFERVDPIHVVNGTLNPYKKVRIILFFYSSVQ
jgi:hypothetical protein